MVVITRERKIFPRALAVLALARGRMLKKGSPLGPDGLGGILFSCREGDMEMCEFTEKCALYGKHKDAYGWEWMVKRLCHGSKKHECKLWEHYFGMRESVSESSTAR